MRRVLGPLGFAMLFLTCLCRPNAADGGIIVNADVDVVYTGVVVSAGQILDITATGQVNISNLNGGYITDANGTLLVAPPVGSGSYNFFYSQPTAGSPTVGEAKDIDPGFGDGIGELAGSPYGGLIAGFATTTSPSSLTDFTTGFVFIGASGTITAPAGASFLFLAVNDINRGDNIGSFTVNVASVPEPSTFTMLGIAAVCAAGVARRRVWAS